MTIALLTAKLKSLSNLSENKKAILVLIILNLIWSIGGIYADLNWLSQVPLELVIFTSICSLYPPLLTIWYLLKYFDKKIPSWFTFFIFVGIASYGILAQFYFPLLMSWAGFNLHDFGSMFWVAFYGLQAFIIFRALKLPTWWQFLLILAYFLFVDYNHYFFPTFVDFLRPGYPLWMKNLTAIVALSVQTIIALTAVRIAMLNGREPDCHSAQPTPEA